MIDWLGSRYGRLAAFFLLYVTEGIPLGYTAIFVATLMRKEGVSPAVIGGFVASLYLPWSFKWAAGPFVDLFKSRRLGPRRAWIVAMQAGMTLALLACGWVDVEDVRRFTWVVVASNIFGAIQDVAIDALAVDSLHESERGLANGLMFAGAAVGQAIGGSGALYLVDSLGFLGATLFVIGCLVGVLLIVSLWLRERPIEAASAAPPAGQSWDAAPSAPELALHYLALGVRRVGRYLWTALVAFFGSWLSLIGLVIALLPAGGHALGLTLQSNLAVELGLSESAIATLNLVSTLTFAPACAFGGWLSDKLGRIRSLMGFIALTAIPTVALAWVLWDAGWVMPVDVKAANRPLPPDGVIMAFWAATIGFNVANGLMYGTRSAFYMDFCDPKVGATQFTAYMAMMNLVIAYTSWWQGHSIEAYGYPTTLVLDAAFGLVCLPLLAVAAVLPKPARPELAAPTVQNRCPVCGADLPPGAAECPKCGERLPVRA